MYVSVLLDITTPGLRDIRDANVTMLRVLPLEEALHLEYDCDARLLPYYFEGKDICPRFTEEGLQSVRNYNKDRPEAERLNLRISTIFLDIDPGTGDQHVADDAWREDVLEKLRASALWSMGLGLYHTRNGIRGVLCLPEAMKVEDAALWQRSCWSYLQALDVPAESISAWNMAYRAPFVRRDGQDLRLPTERLRQIGVLDLMALRRARIEVGLPADPPPLQREVEHVRLTDDEKITENRNRTLFKVGCKLRHIGMSEKEIYAALLAIDLQRCVPPLQREAGGRREISTAAKSAAKYRAAEVLVEGSAEGLAADLMVADILHE